MAQEMEVTIGAGGIGAQITSIGIPAMEKLATDDVLRHSDVRPIMLTSSPARSPNQAQEHDQISALAKQVCEINSYTDPSGGVFTALKHLSSLFEGSDSFYYGIDRNTKGIVANQTGTNPLEMLKASSAAHTPGMSIDLGTADLMPLIRIKYRFIGSLLKSYPGQCIFDLPNVPQIKHHLRFSNGVLDTDGQQIQEFFRRFRCRMYDPKTMPDINSAECPEICVSWSDAPTNNSLSLRIIAPQPLHDRPDAGLVSRKTLFDLDLHYRDDLDFSNHNLNHEKTEEYADGQQSAMLSLLPVLAREALDRGNHPYAAASYNKNTGKIIAVVNGNSQYGLHDQHAETVLVRELLKKAGDTKEEVSIYTMTDPCFGCAASLQEMRQRFILKEMIPLLHHIEGWNGMPLITKPDIMPECGGSLYKSSEEEQEKKVYYHQYLNLRKMALAIFKRAQRTFPYFTGLIDLNGKLIQQAEAYLNAS